MSASKLAGSVGSSLNVDIQPTPKLGEIQNDDKPSEEYFLLKGCRIISTQVPLEEKKAKLEKMLQKEWDKSIQLKGLVCSVDHSCFGLKKEDDEYISLLRLHSKIPHVFKKPVRKFSDRASLLVIPEMHKTYCCNLVPLYQLEVIPNILARIKSINKDIGVTLCIDNARNLWWSGMWFQVATVRHLIGSAYNSVSRKGNDVQVKGLQIKGSAPSHLIDLLNGVKLTFGMSQKTKAHTSVSEMRFYDISLFCLAYLKFSESDIKDPIRISLNLDPETQEAMFAISSVSHQLCQKHCNAMKKSYNDVHKQFCSLALPSTYPSSYIELLTSFIDIKCSPKLKLTMHMGRTVRFVFPKEQHSEALNFKEYFMTETAPRKASDIDDLYRLAKPFDVAAPPTWPGNVKDAKDLTELRPLENKSKVYIGMLVKPEHHIEYLQRHGGPDLDSINQEYNAKLEFNKEQILVQLEKKEDIIICLLRLEKLFSRLAIESKEMLRSCLPSPSDHLLVKDLSYDRVSVTGSHDDMSGILEDSHRGNDAEPNGEDLEVIGIKPERRSDHENKSNKSHNQQAGASQSARLQRPHKRRQRQLAESSLQHSETQDQVADEVRRHCPDVQGFTFVKSPDTTAYRQTQSGSYVEVGLGDITKLQVDAIVNAANNKLIHAGGISRAILLAGGEIINLESKEIVSKRKLKNGDVCVTSAGNLPCKKVIHAVSPCYDQYQNKDECLEDLKKTFLACFQQAGELGCVSLAVPPLSAGLYAVPGENVADVACRTVNDFLKQNPGTCLKHIRFVDIKDDVLALCRLHLSKIMKTID